MRNNSFNIEYLSPTGLIGFWVLFLGLIFTGVMFYFVFFRLNENQVRIGLASSLDLDVASLDNQKTFIGLRKLRDSW